MRCSAQLNELSALPVGEWNICIGDRITIFRRIDSFGTCFSLVADYLSNPFPSETSRISVALTHGPSRWQFLTPQYLQLHTASLQFLRVPKGFNQVLAVKMRLGQESSAILLLVLGLNMAVWSFWVSSRRYTWCF
jgi:hypothetical protein